MGFLHSGEIVDMKEVFNNDDRILVYQGDMMEVMDELGMRFRHCITDPPYGVQRDNNFDTMGRTGTTFGEWDEKENVVRQLPDWISCICRHVDENLVVFNDWHNMGMIAEAMRKNGFEEKELVQWKKTNPMPRNTERRFVPCLEYAIWGVRAGCKWTFNKGADVSYEVPIIDSPIEQKDDYNDHTTSKPLKLMEKLVLLFTNEDDWIVDPFGGSGSIALACHEYNRRIVLIEKDEHYCDIIKRRLEKKTEQLYLF